MQTAETRFFFFPFERKIEIGKAVKQLIRREKKSDWELIMPCLPL